MQKQMGISRDILFMAEDLISFVSLSNIKWLFAITQLRKTSRRLNKSINLTPGEK